MRSDTRQTLLVAIAKARRWFLEVSCGRTTTFATIAAPTSARHETRPGRGVRRPLGGSQLDAFLSLLSDSGGHATASAPVTFPAVEPDAWCGRTQKGELHGQAAEHPRGDKTEEDRDHEQQPLGLRVFWIRLPWLRVVPLVPLHGAARYSITSSARARSVGGIVRPRALAVFAFCCPTADRRRPSNEELPPPHKHLPARWLPATDPRERSGQGRIGARPRGRRRSAQAGIDGFGSRAHPGTHHNSRARRARLMMLGFANIGA